MHWKVLGGDSREVGSVAILGVEFVIVTPLNYTSLVLELRLQLPAPPPFHSSTRFKEVQKSPLSSRIAGFLLSRVIQADLLESKNICWYYMANMPTIKNLTPTGGANKQKKVSISAH